MASFIDFAALKEAFDFDDAIDFLRLDLSPEGNALRGKCPACNKGGVRTLIVTPGRGFYCHAAKKGGDQIALIAHVKEIGMRDAGELVQEQLYGTEASTSRTSTRSIVPDKRREEEDKPPESSRRTGLEPLDYLQHDHEMVQAIGFTTEDAEALGIGYCAKGTMRGYVAIPVRLEDGTLAGYIGIEDAKLPTRWHGISTNVVPLRKHA